MSLFVAGPTRVHLDGVITDHVRRLAELVDPASTGRVWIPLPYDSPPAALRSNGNKGGAHWAKTKATRAVRSQIVLLGRSAGLRPCQHLTVGLVWGPGDRRRRDADNLSPLLKACCDGLASGRADWVGLDLVADDTPTYMTKLLPIIAPPPCPRGVWLLVQPHHAPTTPLESP